MHATAVGGVAALVLLSACAAPAPDAADPRRTPKASATSSATAPASPDPSPDPGRRRSGTRVIVDDSEFGAMLYGADGQAIYVFDRESTTQPRCYDQCADAWPPVLTDGDPVAGRGVRPGLLGTAVRRDHTTQVTYAGRPLYFYAHEEPWQVLCHDFADYGGTWYVVQPGGAPAP